MLDIFMRRHLKVCLFFIETIECLYIVTDAHTLLAVPKLLEENSYPRASIQFR